MREDAICEVRGRIVNRDGAPLEGRVIEFLPTVPFFLSEKTAFCPLGGRTRTDANGEFRMLLSRTDVTRVEYETFGALGRYRVKLNGAGPHNASTLIKAGVRR